MRQWEYLMISGAWISRRTHQWTSEYPRCYRLTKAGPELVTDFQKRPIGVHEADAVVAFIAHLGEEGWELVSTSVIESSEGHTLYFKRLKPEPEPVATATVVTANGEAPAIGAPTPAATPTPAPSLLQAPTDRVVQRLPLRAALKRPRH